MQKRRGVAGRIALAVGFVVLWALLWRALDMATLLAFYGQALELIERHHIIAVAAYALIYVVTVVLNLPVAVFLTLAGASLFGVWIAVPVTLVAATLGACLMLIVARKLLYEGSLRRIGPWFERLKQEFHADAASYLLLVRVAPVFPFFVVNLAAAVLGARLRTFAWTTLVGMIPGTIAYALIGEGLRQTFAEESRRLLECRRAAQATCVSTLDLSALISRDALMGLAGLALLMLMSLLIRRYSGMRGIPPGKTGRNQG